MRYELDEWDNPLMQAHMPYADPPDSAAHDMLAVGGAVAVILLIVFLSSILPSIR